MSEPEMKKELRMEFGRTIIQFILLGVIGTWFSYHLSQRSKEEDVSMMIFESRLNTLGEVHTYLRDGQSTIASYFRALREKNTTEIEINRKYYEENQHSWYAEGQSLESRVKIYYGEEARYLFHRVFLRLRDSRSKIIAPMELNGEVMTNPGQFIMDTEDSINLLTDGMETVLQEEHGKVLKNLDLPNYEIEPVSKPE